MWKILIILYLIVSSFTAWSQDTDNQLASLDAKNSITTCPTSQTASANVINEPLKEQFTTFWTGLLDTSQWPARWYCGTWSSFEGWFYLGSDLAIWGAYFMIPLVMIYFIVKKKNTIPYRSVYLLFVGFILACGLTHLIDAIIFWWPAYRLSAVVRFMTAFVSWGSVFALVKVVPEAMNLPSHKELLKEVSHRKKAEKQLEQKLIELEAMNNELEAFSYSVSHDLRAPLRTIHGFTKALTEDYEKDLNGEAKDYLDRVSNASIRMGHLIDDILDLSRISRKGFNGSLVDFSQLAREVVKDKQSQVKTNASFTIDENMTVFGDDGLLRILLENLIGNAIKYADKKKQTKIHIGRMTSDNNHNVLFVKDNGIGFDMNYADKIFGAFQRLHGDSYEGTGIGLATVMRIINRHQGKIWVESKTGQGTTFYFELHTNEDSEYM